MARRSQLRIYTLQPATADEFVANFRAEIAPLREKYGFSIDSAVLSEDRTRFVWVTSHESPDGWEAAERTYYESPERARLGFDPGQYIIEHDISMVDPV